MQELENVSLVTFLNLFIMKINSLVGVVHVVVDGVDACKAGAGAGIAADGAAVGSCPLGRGVGDAVAAGGGGGAAALEGVEEAEPVANLVGCGLVRLAYWPRRGSIAGHTRPRL